MFFHSYGIIIVKIFIFKLSKTDSDSGPQLYVIFVLGR